MIIDIKLSRLSFIILIFLISNRSFAAAEDRHHEQIISFLKTHGSYFTQDDQKKAFDDDAVIAQFEYESKKHGFNYRNLISSYASRNKSSWQLPKVIKKCQTWIQKDEGQTSLSKAVSLAKVAHSFGVGSIENMCLDHIASWYSLDSTLQQLALYPGRFWRDHIKHHSLSVNLQTEIAIRMLQPHQKLIVAKNCSLQDADYLDCYISPDKSKVLKVGLFDVIMCDAGGKELYHLGQQSTTGAARICYSPKSDLFAVASDKLIVRNSQDGEPLVELPSGDEKSDDVKEIQFNADGSLLGVLYEYAKLCIWNLQNTKTAYPALLSIAGFQMHPKNAEFAIIDVFNNIEIYDSETGNVLCKLKHTDDVPKSSEQCIIYNNDGSQLLSYPKECCSYSKVHVFDARNAELMYLLDLQNSSLYALSISPDNSLIIGALGSSSSAVIGGLSVWQASNGQLRYHQSSEFSYGASVNDFSPDGSLMISRSKYPTWMGKSPAACMKVWDLEQGEMLHEALWSSSKKEIKVSSYKQLLQEAKVGIADAIAVCARLNKNLSPDDCNIMLPIASSVLRNCFDDQQPALDYSCNSNQHHTSYH